MLENKVFSILMTESHSHIMVDKAILMALLDRVPKDVIVQFCQEMETVAPEIGSPTFREWAAKTRRYLDLTQVQVAEAVRIGQEEISKFERGFLPFGATRQKKLRDFYIKKLNEVEEVGTVSEDK